MIFTGIGEKGRLIDHLFCSVGKYVFTEECFYHLFTKQYMQLPFTGYIVIKHTPLQFYRLPVFSPNQIPEEKEYPFYSLFFFLPNRKLKKKKKSGSPNRAASSLQVKTNRKTFCPRLPVSVPQGNAEGDHFSSQLLWS